MILIVNNYFWILIIAIFGVIIGSFLNVVILRYNTGKGVHGRSMCLSCSKQLTFFELIPIISFFVQRRRCKKCKSRISWQYPLVEIGTALMFALIFLKIFLLNSIQVINIIPTEFELLKLILIFIISLVIWSLLIVIFVYDLKHKIIPNSLVYSFIGLSFIYALINYSSLLNFLSGIIFFIPFFLLWYLSDGKWIGLGDGKLAAGIGFLLGFSVGLFSLFIAFLIGAIFSLLFLLISRLKIKTSNITIKSEVPFAPFLIIGTFIGFFLEIGFFDMSLFLSNYLYF
jgi:prepilin signal peptidase PulO-like enzyme (type II secretory pathway)